MSPRVNFDIRPAYCLKLRHKDSSCRLCLDSCPTNAISIDQSLAVDSSLCNGCGICVNVCPTSVFQLPDTPYQRLLGKLKAGSTADYACSRAHSAKGVSTVPCLGYLDEAVLVGAVGSGARAVSLNFAECRRCEQKSGLRAAAKSLKKANRVLALFDTPKRISAIATETDGGHRQEQSPLSSRREFFSFLKQGAQDMVTSAMKSADDAQKMRVTLEPKIPEKHSRLLKHIRALGAPLTDQAEANGLPFAQLEIDRHCDGCGICITFCPTEALKCFDREGRRIIAFRLDYCIDCKLCSDICPKNAITFSSHINPNFLLTTHWTSLTSHKSSACRQCKQTYITRPGTTLCPNCHKKERQERWLANRYRPPVKK